MAVDLVNILTNIRKIVRSVNIESKRIEKSHGISIPQLLALIHLKNRDEYQCNIKELTKVLQLNSSTVTGIVNRLEKKGLVARLPKKDDRRVTNISLTSKGFELVEQSPVSLQEKLMKNKRGSVVAIDPCTGEILAMISACGIPFFQSS